MQKSNIYSALFATSIIFVIPATNASISGCTLRSCYEMDWGYTDNEFNHYEINANYKTSQGTSFDPSNQNISPELIDRLTNEVSYCLENTFPNHTISDDIAGKAFCKNKNIPLPIDKSSFVVKIPNDWILSCDKSEEVLPTPVIAGEGGCIAKGLTPDVSCPCRWRAGMICPNILITTPNFYIYKDVLVRFLTGCQDAWAVPQFANCITPSTTSLSVGNDPNDGIKIN
jgi:hypothetical protein